MDPSILALLLSVIVICVSYKLFNWWLIKKSSIFDPIEPNFFTAEEKEFAEKDSEDQDRFTLTEISKTL